MSSYSSNDIKFMSRAIQLAQLGGVKAAPNPMVGAVITLDDKIIGEGYHRKYGEHHAEVNAVHSVKDKTFLKKATIYVTLEPCSHHGKTPPCADLIVKHQFKRVVIACVDSFAKVSGRGIKKMRDAGIKVEVGLLEKEAREVNKRFFTFHEKGRPYVILKWAQTADGFIDRSQEDRKEGINWITTPAVKPLVHRWRSEEQAILVGWKTINNDNPKLTVREISGPSPHRFIIDPNCRIPLGSHVVKDGGHTTLFVKKNDYTSLPDHIEVIELNEYSVRIILSILKEKGIISLFVEGGASTLQAFINDGLWDEARVLSSDVKFGKGLEAPKITDDLKSNTEKIEDNSITYIQNG
tara:strand:+ start:169128 stop:170183 length:1056 start_codon:yes stop_codon:yes gene_type:complete